MGEGSITWTNIRVKLGDLKPWQENPRLSTKAQAQRLIDSWERYGQVQTIAVSPELDVYDGHQRLSALLTIHNADYEVDARQSSRKLTDAERRKLVIYLHGTTVGTWNWDALSGWDAKELIGWGLDEGTYHDWGINMSALSLMLEAENKYADEYKEMLNNAQEDLTPYKTLMVHLEDEKSIGDFSALINQKITMETKFVWFPKKRTVANSNNCL